MSELESGRASTYIGPRVRIARGAMTQEQLVERLEHLGCTQWRQSKIAKIENGEVKRIALDDVIELAAALGVQLSNLLAPELGYVEITPTVRVEAWQFRRWFEGQRPIEEDDARIYFTGPLVPGEDWLEFTRYNHNPAEGYTHLDPLPPQTLDPSRATPPKGWRSPPDAEGGEQ